MMAVWSCGTTLSNIITYDGCLELWHYIIKHHHLWWLFGVVALHYQTSSFMMAVWSCGTTLSNIITYDGCLELWNYIIEYHHL